MARFVKKTYNNHDSKMHLKGNMNHVHLIKTSVHYLKENVGQWRPKDLSRKAHPACSSNINCKALLASLALKCDLCLEAKIKA